MIDNKIGRKITGKKYKIRIKEKEKSKKGRKRGQQRQTDSETLICILTAKEVDSWNK